jgi:hypothetical protein
MTTIETDHVAFTDRTSALVQRLILRPRRRVAAPEAPEDARARRAFVQEMLSRNPGAFSSELDVQFMMQHYAGSF